MAKEVFSHTAIEETNYLIKKPCAEVPEEKTRHVEFPGHEKVNAAIQRHQEILCQNQTSGCLPCQNCTTKNQQTCWRRKGTGARRPARSTKRISEPTPPLSGMPPAPTSNTFGAHHVEIINLLAGYPYPHTALPRVEFFQDDEHTKHDTDFDPDMLTDEG
jgi:hypothetical protein